jgi:protein-L-isoaspartate(D-aspartate) O-methyltransferase
MNKNMIDGQLKPMGINDPIILEAFKNIPRELFLDKDKSSISYHEGNILIKDNRWLLSSILIARLINCVDISNEDIILEIGSCSGYATAILEKLCSLVVGVEADTKLRDIANKSLTKIEANSSIIVEGQHTLGNLKSAPYDKIFILGAVQSVPNALFSQLTNNGSLVTVIKDQNNLKSCGKAVVFKKNKDIISSSIIFDVEVPFMEGFINKEGFDF